MNRQQFHQELWQLGQDLQAGNLSAAQSDFASLQQDVPQNSTNGSSQNPIGQAFSQLAPDLKSGNHSAAQQDYTTIQQNFKSRSAARQAMHGHEQQRKQHAQSVVQRTGQRFAIRQPEQRTAILFEAGA